MPFNKKAIFATLLMMAFLFGVSACKPAAVGPEAQALLDQLAASGDLIVARRIKAEIPLDPSDKTWEQAQATTIPLISQTSIVPRSPAFKKMDLTIRAIYTTKEIGFDLSWSDPTHSQSVVKSEQFRDAVALAFPINYGADVALPYIGMGNKGRPVNVWHWKASWQADLDRGYQGVAEANPSMVPNNSPLYFLSGAEAGSPLSQQRRESPLENLLAEGFGTLTSSPSPGLTGKGVWQDGAWHVVIKRPLQAKGIGIDMAGGKGGLVPITFAVWDGAGAERNGIKRITRWRFLQLEGEKIALPFLQSLSIGSVPDGDAARGKKLVSKVGCIQCHNLPGGAAVKDVGPDLVHAGSLHRGDYLLESIAQPNAVIVPAPGYYDPSTWTSTMPSYEGALQDKDYADMAEYLRTLQ